MSRDYWDSGRPSAESDLSSSDFEDAPKPEKSGFDLKTSASDGDLQCPTKGTLATSHSTIRKVPTIDDHWNPDHSPLPKNIIGEMFPPFPIHVSKVAPVSRKLLFPTPIFEIGVRFGERFTPVKFVCNSGLPGDIYISQSLYDLISERVKFIGLRKSLSVLLGDGSTWDAVLTLIPEPHETNIFAVGALKIFGFSLRESGFEFVNAPNFI